MLICVVLSCVGCVAASVVPGVAAMCVACMWLCEPFCRLSGPVVVDVGVVVDVCYVCDVFLLCVRVLCFVCGVHFL